ncbi:Flavodoxin 2 [Lasiodiplodia theobromae]|uniref:Flavodoxin 2 n=1 Tax=Lasiodiplodia theobromae TaxID=45133 RepID=UPI0015C3417C|nr:Flavodoxin 2 [Lasiodiplodia theobromae]KAF4535895.1 Flavodoxin 2 [Lasiodiplodia theobromae]
MKITNRDLSVGDEINIIGVVVAFVAGIISISIALPSLRKASTFMNFISSSSFLFIFATIPWAVFSMAVLFSDTLISSLVQPSKPKNRNGSNQRKEHCTEHDERAGQDAPLPPHNNKDFRIVGRPMDVGAVWSEADEVRDAVGDVGHQPGNILALTQGIKDQESIWLVDFGVGYSE